MDQKDFRDHVIKLLTNLPDITSRAMFGGYGLYREGIIFGMIIDSRLYFKVDDSNRNLYISHQSQPFTYTGASHKLIKTSYWEVPSEIMNNTEKLTEWLETSFNISLSKKKNKN